MMGMVVWNGGRSKRGRENHKRNTNAESDHSTCSTVGPEA